MKNRKLKSAVRSLQQEEGTAQLEKLGSGEIQILKGGTGRETPDCNGYTVCNGYSVDHEEN
ncbi:MAG: hypothetical protein V6Z82_05280 [Flavobacteriales bacterium]